MRKPRIREPSYQYLLFTGRECGTFDPAVLGEPPFLQTAMIGGYAVEFAHVEGGHDVRMVDRTGVPVFAEVFMCRRRERSWGWQPTLYHRFVLGRRPREMMMTMVSVVGDVRTATDIHVCPPSPNPDRYTRWFTEHHSSVAVPWLGPSITPRHVLNVDRLRNRIIVKSLHEHDVPRMGRLTFLTLTHVRLKVMARDDIGSAGPEMDVCPDGGGNSAGPRLVWSNGRPIDHTDGRREAWVA